MIRVGEIFIPWGYTTQSIFPEELFNEGYDPYWKEWITVFH